MNNTASITQDQFQTALRYLIATGGAFAAGRGWITSDTLNALLIAGSVAGPMAWGLYVNWQKSQQVQVATAVGVQAGINMTVQGKALAEDGTVVSRIGQDTTPVKPVTLATSPEIVANFGPDAKSIAKT